MAEQFKYLFSPLKIGSMEVRNRIVSSPHGTCLAQEDGLPSEDQAYYYAEKAKGGAGMIVMGASYVHPTGMALPKCNRIYDDRSIPGLRRIAEAVHAHGGKMLGQLGHAGAQFIGEVNELPLWAPSVVPYPLVAELAHEMETREIEEYIEGTVHSALNYKAGGFDGVELYPAHAYLFGEFLSPFTNKRTDIYGGTFENRLRILFEIIDRVREAVGKEFVIGIRISADEFTDGGLTLADMARIAPMIEATGKVDYIHVSQSGMMHKYTQVPDMHAPLGVYAYLAAGIKESLKEMPVVVVCRINDPVQAEKVLADGHADLVTMNRATICDPEMPNKAKEGRLDDIRTCIACNQGCIERVVKGFPIRCIQNAAAGREKELGIGTLKPAPKRKRVLVVGGGPAGMEAARVAALRGHGVELYEREGELGGQVRIATKATQREEFGGIVRYLELQLQKLGVKVHLGKEITPEEVQAAKPDAVVVATGSKPVRPGLPGMDQANVVEVQECLLGRAQIGERVLVVEDGEGYWKCCGTAEFLANQGKQVMIMTPNLFVGRAIDDFTLEFLLERLGEKKVVFLPNRMLIKITGKAVLTKDVYTREEIEIADVDTVVWAFGYRAENQLYHTLNGKIEGLLAVGDCIAPRRVRDAIREGHLAGRTI